MSCENNTERTSVRQYDLYYKAYLVIIWQALQNLCTFVSFCSRDVDKSTSLTIEKDMFSHSLTERYRNKKKMVSIYIKRYVQSFFDWAVQNKNKLFSIYIKRNIQSFFDWTVQKQEQIGLDLHKKKYSAIFWRALQNTYNLIRFYVIQNIQSLVEVLHFCFISPPMDSSIFKFELLILFM